MTSRPTTSPVPEHVAIIMDGNGRWARLRKRPPAVGHRAGLEAIRRVGDAADKLGVRVLTVYAFSTENWSRPRAEVGALMRLFDRVLREEVEGLHRRGAQLRFCGRTHELSPHLQRRMAQAVERTRHNRRSVLNVAINYGGRVELVDAIRAMARAGVDLEQVDEATVSRHLYTQGLPDPDLVIRTAGEVRLSNFLLWQSAYAEFFVSQTLWPDFGEADLRLAIESFQQRKRRFGGRPADAASG
jgi:undecaprenyl diphosphate synthase